MYIVKEGKSIKPKAQHEKNSFFARQHLRQYFFLT